MTSISSNALNNPGIERFLYELRYAINGLTGAEIAVIMKLACMDAGKQTISQKTNALRFTWDKLNNTITRYKNEGFKQSANDDLKNAGDIAVNFPNKLKKLYKKFLKLPREKQIEQVAILLLTLSIFFLAGGGSDFEGGLPDKDIDIVGIGSHRNLFSHTVLLGFTLEFAARTGIIIFERIKERLPKDHLPVWDNTYNFIDRNKEISFAALWAGIGIHLLKDSALFAGGFKPYTGLPHGLPAQVHKGLFAANGIACELFASQSHREKDL